MNMHIHIKIDFVKINVDYCFEIDIHINVLINQAINEYT